MKIIRSPFEIVVKCTVCKEGQIVCSDSGTIDLIGGCEFAVEHNRCFNIDVDVIPAQLNGIEIVERLLDLANDEVNEHLTRPMLMGVV